MPEEEVGPDELAEWGLHFIDTIDKIIDEEDATIQIEWRDSPINCMPWIKAKYPDLSEEQTEWLEDFLEQI